MSYETRALCRAMFIAAVLSGLALPAYAAETAVDQMDLEFVPTSVTINVGDSVRFTNSDRIAHDVTIVNPDGTSEDKGMNSYMVGIVVTFPKTGVYQVRCRIHPAMRMTITVK
jgi:plastocyanin